MLYLNKGDNMKKIAIFSDIHGNLQALNSIVEDIDKDNFDEVIFLGDVVGAGPNPKECLDILMDSNIKVVKGNHEIYQTDYDLSNNLLSLNEIEHRNWIHDQLNEEEIKYLKNLPMEYEELIYGKLFNFSHFFLNNSKNYFESLNILGDKRVFNTFRKIENDYMFIGHSHSPFQINNTSLLTCVGSSGCRKNNSTFYTILEVDSNDVRITKKEIVYDRKAFEKEIKNKDYPDRERVADIFFGIKIKED